MKKVLLIFTALIYCLLSQAQITKTTSGGVPAYEQWVRKDKPAIIFLHGIGERGTNLELAILYGPIAMIKAGSKEKHLIDCNIVHLQLGKDKGSWPTSYVLNSIKELIAKGVDPNRIYLLGVSLGGAGVWNCLGDPSINKYLAAAVLMAPGGSPAGKEKIIAESKVPIRIGIGDADKVVNYTTSLNAYRAIENINPGQVRLDHVGLGGHNTSSSWGRYMEPDNFFLWDWLFNQAKNKQNDTGYRKELIAFRLHMELHMEGFDQDLYHLDKLLYPDLDSLELTRHRYKLDTAIHK